MISSLCLSIHAFPIPGEQSTLPWKPLCSPGIGKAWIERHKDDITYKYVPGKSRTDYTLNTGTRVKLPTYYRNKIYTDEERERIWREFMDTERITIRGNAISLRKVEPGIVNNIQSKARECNIGLGYGDDSDEWKKRPYAVTVGRFKKQKKREFEKNLKKIMDKFG